MFIKKLMLGIAGGAALWLVAFVISVTQGEPIQDGLKTLPGVIFVSVLLVLWFTRDVGEDYDGGEEARMPSADQQIGKLQNQLRTALQHAAYNEQQGDLTRAGYWKAQAAVLESQLRNLNA